MQYVWMDDLEPEMILAQDVRIFYPVKILLLRKNDRLTQKSIVRLQMFKIKGVYIISNDPNVIKRQPLILNESTKIQALQGLETIFSLDAFDAPEHITENLKVLSNTVSCLVDDILSRQGVFVSIENLKSHDEYTQHHCLSVSVLSVAVGMHLGLSKIELAQLGMAALLHDIGKIIIPIEILNKPARLTASEFDVIRQHSKLGCDYLKKYGIGDEAIYQGVIGHHEKWDGTGYPCGLSGNNIPLLGRIIGVADVYDALTSSRPYRSPAMPSDAMEYLMGNCGLCFDADIVSAFLNKVELYPIGSCVHLSNGQDYIVVDNMHNLRPIVRSFDDPNNVIDLFSDRSAYNIIITSMTSL